MNTKNAKIWFFLSCVKSLISLILRFIVHYYNSFSPTQPWMPISKLQFSLGDQAEFRWLYQRFKRTVLVDKSGWIKRLQPSILSPLLLRDTNLHFIFWISPLKHLAELFSFRKNLRSQIFHEIRFVRPKSVENDLFFALITACCKNRCTKLLHKKVFCQTYLIRS